MQNASKRYRRDPEKICNKLIAFVEPLLLILIDAIRIWCLSGMFNGCMSISTTTSDIHFTPSEPTHSLSPEKICYKTVRIGDALFELVRYLVSPENLSSTRSNSQPQKRVWYINATLNNNAWRYMTSQRHIRDPEKISYKTVPIKKGCSVFMKHFVEPR